MSVKQKLKFIKPSLGLPEVRRARSYLAVGIICGMLVLVSALALTIVNMGKSLPTKATDTSTDTGAAKVTAVKITQAGTGASVTIGGETTTPTGEALDETQYGNNTTRRKILNNNVAVYKVNYNVTKAGKITLKFKLPANTPIDKSSIASCADGSKLSTESSVNPWNDKTEQSYAYNVAECVVDADSTGSGEWAIRANLWGGNGEKITPTVSVSGVAQDVNVDAITILARAKYYVHLESADGYNQGAVAGWNKEATLKVILNSEKPDGKTGLGIEPLQDDITIKVSINLPDGWAVDSQWIVGGSCDPLLSGASSYDCLRVGGVHNGGLYFSSKGSQIFDYEVKGVVSGHGWCPQKYTDGRCVVFSVGQFLKVPTSKLTTTPTIYTAKSVVGTYETRSGVKTIIDASSAYNWSLYNHYYGNPVPWAPPTASWVGVGQGEESYYTNDQPVYRGETIKRGAFVQLNTVPDNPYANNLYYCQTFNPSLVKITGEYVLGNFNLYKGYGVYNGSKTGFEYGVVGSDNDVMPTSNKSACGQYGKGDVTDDSGNITAKFFKSLKDAQSYASSNGLRVNSTRLWVEKFSAGIRNNWIGDYEMKVLGSQTDAINMAHIAFNSSGETDEWNKKSDGTDSQDPYHGPYANYGVKLVPGILQPKPTLSSDSVYPGGTLTATVTPVTWNNDTNAKLTITLPKGISLRAGSIKQNGTVLAVSDYTITTNDNGTTTVEITGNPIAGQEPTETLDSAGLVSDVQAADNDGKGIEGTPITMELVAGDNIETPSTATLSVAASGTGTDRTVESFRKKSVGISFANPPKMFSYGLTSLASTLYPAEDLTYNLTIGNNTDYATGDGGVDAIGVLPYDGDSRGTANLKSYKVSQLKITSVNTTNAKVYYTTDAAVREMDKVSGSDTTAAASVLKIADDDTKVKWTECKVADGVCNLPTGETITSVRIKTGSMASGDKINVSYTLANILPNVITKSGKIGGDLAYLSADGMTDPVAHVAATSTDVAGDTVGMSLTSSDGTLDSGGNLTISKQLGVNSLIKVIIKANVASATFNGADFTVGMPSTMTGTKTDNNGNKFSLRAFADNVEPAAGTAGYSLQVDDGTWSISQNKAILSGSVRKTLQTVFATSSAAATPADTYTGKITFTITAKQ